MVKITKNIERRASIGHGQTSNIMNILREVSLGQYFFQMATLLRQTVFMSSVLLNSEAWVGLTQANISKLEGVDFILLRRILNAPSKTPIPSLFMELGIYPIRFTIMARRILFLHYILNCSSEEMLSKVFWVQEENPLKSDWVNSVKEDLKFLNLDHYLLNDIKNMKKSKLKAIVKSSIKKKAFEYLLKEKDKKSKMKQLTYKKLEMQEYIKSNKMSFKNKKILFKLRTRMIPVGYNFGRKVKCPLCHVGPDNQEHLLSCIIIKISCPEIMKNSNSKYSDIFSENIQKMDKVASLIEKALRKRDEIIN